MQEVLLATLGTAPQVVTLVLDSLLQRGYKIDEVLVLHMSSRTPRVADAVKALEQEKAFYRKAAIRFRLQVFRDDQELEVVDTLHAYQADAVRRVLFQELQALKRKRWRVHLSIAGGRKTMSAYGLVAAQMLFDADDRCWHLLSEDRVIADGRLHGVAGDDINLVEVPVLRWSDLSFDAYTLARSSDPFALVQSAEAQFRQKRARLQEFQNRLSPSQRKIFHLMVHEGLEAPQIAARLGLAAKSVQNLCPRILEAFCAFSGEPDAGYLRMVAYFSPGVG